MSKMDATKPASFMAGSAPERGAQAGRLAVMASTSTWSSGVGAGPEAGHHLTGRGHEELLEVPL